MADEMSIDKKEPIREGSGESMTSTPDAEPSAATPQEPSQQKRKGGRKPIYATSEERKQRNRQAQAAFRERRTEYIKQLEETIRVHETNLHNLQTAHRSAADECLMLRYKNSLLERILLEKGIDVQAELRAKTGSPALGPTHVAPNMAQPPTAQRAIMNRHHQARRSVSNIAPKLEPGMQTNPSASIHSLQSPRSHQSGPSPPSHASSPTAHSPGFQGVMTPPASETQVPRLQQPMKPPMSRGMPGGNVRMMPPMKTQGSGAPSSMGGHQGYYPSPFSNHIEQLEQEYDAQHEVVDEQETPTHDGVNHGPSYQRPYEMNRAMQQQQQGAQAQTPTSTDNGPGFTSMTDLMNPYDPMLDMDPFGLSASMHFPTQFSFDTSSMR